MTRTLMWKNTVLLSFIIYNGSNKNTKIRNFIASSNTDWLVVNVQ